MCKGDAASSVIKPHHARNHVEPSVAEADLHSEGKPRIFLDQRPAA